MALSENESDFCGKIPITKTYMGFVQYQKENLYPVKKKTISIGGKNVENNTTGIYSPLCKGNVYCMLLY